ncbi:hydrogenase formation protein HypD [Lyngbya confervoides]|uniref:Hydrogenase formation protein HypD n=1 Tax=Lyngbya confervoides BDU141951 TaxID=1574623 RepID=A0ABD4SYT3_9CYAN|nr:hydrogenase formation protein HypD [Lyngbya confervoides]MCM1981454.1 hydrogenase formation protein HypD [Lyngbya confervoides BDU141951]
MKYIDEYRNPEAVQPLRQAIARCITRPWRIMEICGGQTHAIIKYGLDRLLPPEIQLIHGPGCPVCVTAAETIDTAIALAQHSEVILCSYGDMLRVPGSLDQGDLLSAKATGSDVRVLYSPLDVLKIAQENPQKEVIFFAVGFETTAPATAATVYQAKQQSLSNLSFLVSHVRVPPAMEVILSAPDCQIHGFLAAGHVCTVMGMGEYEAIADRFQVPIVITGFEPADILRGIYHCLQQLEAGSAQVENQYARSVRPQGNTAAQQLMQTVFEIVPQTWRGLGQIPASGLALRPEFALYDVRNKAFPLPAPPDHTPSLECISGLVLQGLQPPTACPVFGGRCTPDHPLGAPMVSSEGACAAYYRYRPSATF